ncbi:MAG: hypothetical protein ACKVIS_08170, partial [Pseudomonadales bacterium]
VLRHYHFSANQHSIDVRQLMYAHSQSAVGETLRVEGSRLLEADANREIVHFRHTLVKFSKPFFPRSFGVVNLKTRLLGTLLYDIERPCSDCRRYTWE